MIPMPAESLGERLFGSVEVASRDRDESNRLHCASTSGFVTYRIEHTVCLFG